MPPQTGKEALLQWCKNNTAGLAFCALIHKFCPDKLDFDSLKKEEKAKNLKIAFDTGEMLGIPALLDVEDMLIPKPEPLSTITYLSQYYHKFSKLRPVSTNLSKNNNNTNVGVDLQAWSEDSNKENELAAKRAEEYRIKNEEIKKEENERRMQENHKRLSMWKQQQTQISPQQKNDTCPKCGEALEGETVEISALHKEYHKRCFVCTTCNKKLSSKPLLVEENPYCEQCGKQAFIKAQLGKRNEPSSTSQQHAEMPRNDSPKLESAQQMEKMRSASAPPKPVAATIPQVTSPSLPSKQMHTTTAPSSTSSPAPTTSSTPSIAPSKTSTQPTATAEKPVSQSVQSPTLTPKTSTPATSSSTTQNLVCVKCRNKQASGKYCSKCGGVLMANTEAQSPTIQTKPRNFTVSSPTSTPKNITTQSSNVNTTPTTIPAKVTQEPAKATEPVKIEPVKSTQEPVKAEVQKPEVKPTTTSVQPSPVKATQDTPKATEATPTQATPVKATQEPAKAQEPTQTAPVKTTPTVTSPTLTPKHTTTQPSNVNSTQASTTAAKTEPVKTEPVKSPQPSRGWHKVGIADIRPVSKPQEPLKVDEKGNTLYGVSLDTLLKESQGSQSDTMYGEQLAKLKSTRGGKTQTPPRDNSPPPDKKPPMPPHRVVSQHPTQALPPRNYHARTDEDAIQLSGWLLKRDTTGSVRRWRRRWFVVQRDQLLYWKDEPEKFTLGRENPPQGSISLREVVSVEPDLENGRPCAFKIVAHQMTYCFQADDEETEFRWIAGLVQVVCVLQLEEREKDRAAQQQHLVLTVDTGMFTKEGILKVRSGVFNNWKERFIILKGGVLFFQSKKKQKYEGKFALYNAKLEEYEPETQPNCFKITDVSTDKSVIIKASSEEEMHSWLNAIVKQKLIITEIIDCITIE